MQLNFFFVLWIRAYREKPFFNPDTSSAESNSAVLANEGGFQTETPKKLPQILMLVRMLVVENLSKCRVMKAAPALVVLARALF